MDHYKDHIAKVGAEYSVITTSNVCNEQGQVLVPQGHLLEEKSIDKIVKFKLQRPVEESISIQSEIDHNLLYEILSDYMCASNDLFNIFSKGKLAAIVQNCCEYACRSGLVRQKITVLSIQYSAVFQQTLFVAWFSAHIYHVLKKPEEEIYQAFLAALMRDLGLLHIDPAILCSQGSLSDNQWKQLTSHPIISKKIAEGVKYADNICLQGILQHHENTDGTGFPTGKRGDALNELGQVLNMLDNTYAVYRKSYLPIKRNIADVVPILQINTRPQIQAPFNALLTILKLTNKTEHNIITHDSIFDVMKDIKQGYAYIDGYIKTAYSIINEFVKNTKGPQLATLQKGYLRIRQSVNQSGLINDAYLRWLEQVEKEKIESAYREAEDVYMMMKEVIYHIEKVNILLTQYIAQEGSSYISQAVPDLFDKLMDTPKPQFDSISY